VRLGTAFIEQGSVWHVMLRRAVYSRIVHCMAVYGRAQHVWSRAVCARALHLRIRHGMAGNSMLGTGHVMLWLDRDGYGRTMGLWLNSDLLSPARLIPGCDNDKNDFLNLCSVLRMLYHL
jgi:hypothetical protein